MTFYFHPPVRILLLIALVAIAGVATFRGVVSGQVPPPPPPDFTTIFGPVQLDGQNIVPNDHLIIAMVNGRGCGYDTTKVAADDPSNAPDIGKTVFAINVLADGTGSSQALGCGVPGDRIYFYFPDLRRFATETAQFVGIGFERTPLTLSEELTNRIYLPLVVKD